MSPIPAALASEAISTKGTAVVITLESLGFGIVTVGFSWAKFVLVNVNKQILNTINFFISFSL
jgi:hypothetical protein